ncbi:phosphohistidine phosphatase [Alteromonadaceae bacterium Bs31]|nr:phosphohistidine phosphatase [Alteromonadaceae bacterium Bs31]
MKKSKTLYLVRHAKSSWSDPSLSDLERPLNKRGERSAPEMAKRLLQHISQEKDKFPEPELIISSPALRAHVTAKILAKELDFKAKNIKLDERLYFQGAKKMLEVIYELGGNTESLMIVGHNPDISELHNLLNKNKIDRMPTCAVATLHFDTKKWPDIKNVSASLVDFDYPKKTLKIC